MKKKLFLLTLLVLFLPAFLFAQTRVVDNAGLLSDSEKADLESRLTAVRSSYGFDLVIVSEKDIGTVQPRDYAADFFDNGGYGDDGCLFLQVTGSRDYYFSTSGRGIKILNSTAGGKLEKDVLRFLSNNDYAGAYLVFVNDWETFLALDAKGRNYNFFHRWNVVLLLISWAIAFLIGFIVVQSWKAQMNTALPQKQADSYVVSGSLSFTSKNERFLYSNVSKTSRQSETSSLASSAARSFTSSSGKRHGGRGGKY